MSNRQSCSLIVMATLRIEVLGLSSRQPWVKGFSAALLEVFFFFISLLQFVMIVIKCVSCRPLNLNGTCLGLVPPSPTAITLLKSCPTSYRCLSSSKHFSGIVLTPADPPATVHLPKEDLSPTFCHPWIAQFPSGLSIGRLLSF